MKLELEVTDDAADAIRRYTDVLVEATERDEFSPRALEDARSYAVEALRRILAANPAAFDFVDRLADVAVRKAGGR